MVLGSMRWSRIIRPLAVSVLAAGLGLVGCNQKSDAPRNVEQTKDKEDSDLVAERERLQKETVRISEVSGVNGHPADAKHDPLFAGNDPMHQPFANAVRAGDNPPADEQPPPDVTMTGKSVYKLHQEVIRQWETIRFVTPDGKKIAYTATIDTALGSIDIELRPELAPNHVRNFIALARAGYYDGLVFDRVYHDISVENPKEQFDQIEAGCPLGTGQLGYGHIGYWLYPEFQPSDKVTHEDGTVGACHGFEADTAACRFYITLCKFPGLDGNFTAFGKVTRGLDVAHKIYGQPFIVTEQDGDQSHRPEQPVVMRKVTIRATEQER